MGEPLYWIGGVLHAHGPDERPDCHGAHTVGLCIVNRPDPRHAALVAAARALLRTDDDPTVTEWRDLRAALEREP